MKLYFQTLKRTFDFKSRAGRREFWTFQITNAILSNIFILFNINLLFFLIKNFREISFDNFNSLIPMLGVKIYLTFVGTIFVIYRISHLSLLVRRMHDLGKRWWFIFIPFYNLYLCFLEGVDSTNKYGEKPLEKVNQPLNFSAIFKRIPFPLIVISIGQYLIFYNVNSSLQTPIFILSSYLIYTIGIIYLLFSLGEFSRKGFLLSGVFSGVVSLVLLFLSYQSVRDTEVYNSNYKACKSLAISNLSDLRTIQLEYLKTYKKYASSPEELKEFLKSATTDSVATQGSVPARKLTVAERDFLYRDNRPIDNNMTLSEAYLLSKSKVCPDDLKDFKYDTLKTSLIGSKFMWNKSYKESRAKSGFYKFNVDSLFIVPFTGGKEKWKFEVATVKKGKDDVPVMRISGKIPFAEVQGKKNELLFVGKLDVPEATPVGSWEDE